MYQNKLRPNMALLWIQKQSLGRWRGDGSEGYVRVHRARTEKIREDVAARIRQGLGKEEFLGEEDTLNLLGKYLERAGLEAPEVLAQLEALRSFHAGIR